MVAAFRSRLAPIDLLKEGGKVVVVVCKELPGFLKEEPIWTGLRCKLFRAQGYVMFSFEACYDVSHEGLEKLILDDKAEGKKGKKDGGALPDAKDLEGTQTDLKYVLLTPSFLLLAKSV